MMWHENVNIPPFGVLNIGGHGSIGLVACSASYVGYSEGKDSMRIFPGQVLPCDARKAELINPFSFTIRAQIIRGAPVNTVAHSVVSTYPDLQGSRSGCVLKTAAGGGDAAGRRRGIGFIPKRGVYSVTLRYSGGSNDDFEIMTIPNASYQFVPFRPAGVFAEQLPMVRRDGTVNDQAICLAGSYTTADIDAWKASVGHTKPLQKSWSSTGLTFRIGPETAIFMTCNDAAVVRYEVDALELGDMETMQRGY